MGEGVETQQNPRYYMMHFQGMEKKSVTTGRTIEFRGHEGIESAAPICVFLEQIQKFVTETLVADPKALKEGLKVCSGWRPRSIARGRRSIQRRDSTLRINLPWIGVSLPIKPEDDTLPALDTLNC